MGVREGEVTLRGKFSFLGTFHWRTGPSACGGPRGVEGYEGGVVPGTSGHGSLG